MPTRVSDAFQSRFTEPGDISQLFPQGVVVTIEAVRPYQATMQQQPGVASPEPDVAWMMKVRELKKPIRLKGYCANSIAAALQEEDMDRWFGRTVKICGIQVMAYGKMVWVVNAEDRAPIDRPSLPLNSDLKLMLQERYAGRLPGGNGGDQPNAMDLVPIGKEGEVRIKTALAGLIDQQASWDDFLRWMKTEAPAALPDAFGVDIPEVPRYIGQHFNGYIRWVKAGRPRQQELQPPAPPPPPPPVSPPPVIRTPPGRPANDPREPWAGPGGQPMGEDDIPF